MLRAIVITGLLLAATPSVAGAEPWRWPVRGEVVGAFTATPVDPYAAGRRRGITIAAPPGSVVRSACAGRVVFAGAVGTAGPTVSVQCRAARATYQGLDDLLVPAGKLLAPGHPIARMGPAGRLKLGARVAEGRYRDPAELLASDPLPLGPAPGRGLRRTDRVPPPAFPPRTVAHRRPTPTPTPLAAWLGLALLAAGLPLGGLAHWQAWRRRAGASAGAGRAARAQ